MESQPKPRSALAIIFLTIFVDMLGFGVVVPILAIYVKGLTDNDFLVGAIAAIFAVANFIFTPLLGSISDRYGRRPIILISVTLNALGYLLFAYSTTSLLLLFASRVLNGIGSANIAASQAYLADSSTPENRTKAMGILEAAFGLGFVFGPPLGGFLKVFYGIQSVGWVAAELCAANVLLVFFILPESLKHKNPKAEVRFIPISGYLACLRKPIYNEIYLMSLFYIGGFMAYQTVVSVLWNEHYGQNELHVSIWLAVTGFLTAVVQGGLVGRLVKRYGEEKLLVWGNYFMCIGLLMVPFAPQSPIFFEIYLVTAIACLAFGSGCLTPSMSAIISRISPSEEQGTMLGLAQSFGTISRILGPLLGGTLYHFHYTMPFVVGAAMMVVCLFLANKTVVLLKKQ